MLQAERDGLLAEDVLAGFGGLHDEVGVGVGGGANQHGIDLRVGDDLVGSSGHLGNVAARRQRLRGLAVHVGDGD